MSERPTREHTLQLMASKDRMESELRELLQVLETNGTDMTQPLVDQEGFPRSDIDVYQVRQARHKIICLRNDLKSLTEQIESALHSLHAQQREGLGVSDKSSILEEFNESTVPFAKIGPVTEGSPAARAGLKTDDLILGFGSLRIGTFSSLQDVAQIVQHSVDREIALCVRRSERSIIPLTLVPRSWSGKGLLGCVILPFDNVDR